MILFIAGFGINLYRLQMIQLRLVKQLAQNISCGDTALSFRSKYRNAQLEELTDELREAMRMYKKRTMEANEIESWQKLIRVMGHEIMNSITPIISLSETLSTREVEYSQMQKGMQVIHKRSKGLLEFVENYRRITRIPAPIKEKVCLADLFNCIAELIPNDYISFAQPAPQISIKIDRNQIEQVLINIIKNAIEACEYIDSPKIQIESFVSNSGTVSILVSDNGPGILPDVMDKIFIPFFTTKEHGSGIGLSLCKQIMHLHGGNIVASSIPNKGSIFTITFEENGGTLVEDIIGEYAFSGCTNVAQITNFPTTLTSIGRYTFSGCTKLTNDFVSAHLTDSIEIIYEGAYSDCTALTKVVVPNSVKHLDKGVFAGCTALTEITVPFVGMGYELNKLDNTVSNELNTTTLFGYIFTTNDITDNTDILPRSLKTVTITSDFDIIDKAFINCANLTKVFIPATVKNIGVEAFRNCRALNTFNVPTSLEHMGASAFEKCEKITSFPLPETVTELSESVFSSCSALKELDITHVTYIGKFALFNCKNLTVVISGENPNYEVVDSVLYSKGQEQLIRYPSSLKNKTFTVPAAVKVICEGSFQACTSLKELILPNRDGVLDFKISMICHEIASPSLSGSVAR